MERRRTRLQAGLLGALWLAGCGEDSASLPDAAVPDGGGGASPGACELGEFAHPAGGCCPAGSAANEAGGCCPAGTLPQPDGSCLPAGIPPDACAEGFAPDGEQGCEPILPAEPCPAGLMAVPGETACREVAPCGVGPWGNIPVEPNTEHVDATYSGGNSDGSAAQPWSSIQDGIDAAASGAIVAVAAGSYVEDLTIAGKAVRVWGRCPSLVELIGTGALDAVVRIGALADGTELRSLAITGPAWGIGLMGGSSPVVLDRLWVHDTAGPGVVAMNELGPTTLALSGSLIEGAHDLGLYVLGTVATVDATVVRDSLPGGQGEGRGINVASDPWARERPLVAVRASIIERNHVVGLFVGSADATLEASVVRGTVPDAHGYGGWGVNIQPGPLTLERPNAALRGSVIDTNTARGAYIAGADVVLDNTVIRGTLPPVLPDASATGLHIQDDMLSTDERANAVALTAARS